MNARGKALLVLLLASLGAFAAGQSPTQTVLAFAKAVSQRDAKAASALVDGGKQNTALPLEMPKISVSLANISETVTGTSSIVSYRITITGQGRVPKPQSEMINLVQRNRKWLIVPWSAGQSQSRYLASIAYMLSAPGAMRDTEDSARMTACLSNLKQIAVAALMLANDFGDNFKFSASNFKVKLTPYLKKPVWHCPSSAGVEISYSPNPAVLGKPISSIGNPSVTVLFYEGKDGKLNFAHTGRAAVAFVDGHVKMLRKEGTKSLIWKP